MASKSIIIYLPSNQECCISFKGENAVSHPASNVEGSPRTQHKNKRIQSSKGVDRNMPRRPVRRKDADLFIEDETDTFKDAVRAGKLSTVQEMLGAVTEEDAGSWCCEALDNFGRTALHHVLAGPDQEQILLLARFLCRQRADPNASDENGVTPLHLAAQRGSKHVIRSLLCARAENQQRTSDGRSTVDFAQFNPSPVEAFEVVGWPGKGPELQPLEPKKAKSQAAATEAQPAPQSETSPSLFWPLLLAGLWFALLGLLSIWVIRAV